jgi:Amt family ammonium transporter
MASGKPSVVGAAAGAVAGLVAITPASGFVTPMASLIIGGAAGALCYFAVRMRAKVGLDDSLDVVGVHGVGGAWGALATGLFATAAVSGLEGTDGLFYGDAGQFVDQLIAVGVTLAYSFIVTFIILKVLDAVMGLRVTEEEELAGIDASQHGERGYLLDSGPGYAGIPVAEAVQTSYAPSATPPTPVQGAAN